jgi:homoserine kinase type II
LSGLVDFGSMGLDSVAGDLARLLGEAIGPDRLARREAMAAFEAIRPLSEEEHRAIAAFEQANALLGPSMWIYRHFFEGRKFDEPDAVVRGFERTLTRLDETF